MLLCKSVEQFYFILVVINPRLKASTKFVLLNLYVRLMNASKLEIQCQKLFIKPFNAAINDDYNLKQCMCDAY